MGLQRGGAGSRSAQTFRAPTAGGRPSGEKQSGERRSVRNRAGAALNRGQGQGGFSLPRSLTGRL